MTRREWAAACLQDMGCPDDMLDFHLDRLGIQDDPWTTPDDGASGGMERHNERAALRAKVEAYERSLCPGCGGDKGNRLISCGRCTPGSTTP